MKSSLRVASGPRKSDGRSARERTPHTSSEDELLASSQEAVGKVAASTSHSTSAPSKIQDGTSHSSKKVNHPKSSKATLKSRYQKATFILAKIEKNRSEGRIDEQDEVDKSRYQAVVKEYEASLSRKRPRSLEESPNTPAQPRGKRSRAFQTGGTASSAKTMPHKTMSDVVKDQLRVALVDELAPKRLVSNDLWTKMRPNCQSWSSNI